MTNGVMYAVMVGFGGTFSAASHWNAGRAGAMSGGGAAPGSRPSEAGRAEASSPAMPDRLSHERSPP